MKAMTDDTWEEVLEKLKGMKASLERQLEEGMERALLHGDVMLSLEVVRQAAGEAMFHQLGLRLRGTRPYVLMSGEEFKFVEASGLHVPERPEVTAAINFQRKDRIEHIDGWVKHNDEEWGVVFARHEEVIRAYETFTDYFKSLESHYIDLKAVCPQADFARKGQTYISVENFLGYFKKFNHYTEKSLENHYNSGDEKRNDIAFVPGESFLRLVTNEKAE
jgi:hypothetical protein